MKESSPVNLEMSIVLPLGVVAHQLMKIEADLRLLNMKALDFARERENAPHTGFIEARLEKINEALESIRVLVSDIAADLRRDAAQPVRADHHRRGDRDD
jgi:hypothetical protein